MDCSGGCSSRAAALSDLRLDRVDDVLQRETKFLLQLLQRSRRAERAHGDDRSARADPALPAKGLSLLDCHTSRDARGDDTITICLVLFVDDFPGRHAHNARLDSVFLQ